MGKSRAFKLGRDSRTGEFISKKIKNYEMDYGLFFSLGFGIGIIIGILIQYAR